MRILLIYVLIFTSLTTRSQTAYEGATVILAKESEAIFSYYQYDPYYLAIPNVVEFENIQLEYPEQFFHALISAKSQAWIDSLSYEKKSYERKQGTFSDQKRFDINNNYFQLSQKITIDFEGAKYVLIRFKLKMYSMPEAMTGVYTLQLDNGKWKYLETPKFGDLANVFRVFKIEYFEDLLNGDSEDEQVRQVINEVTIDGQIDWLLLNNKVSLWGYERGLEKDYFLRY